MRISFSLPPLLFLLTGCGNLLDLGGKTELDHGAAPGLQTGTTASRVIAVGDNGTVVVRDGDGRWTIGTTPVKSSLYAVATNARQVVVGGGDGVVLVSQDGTNYRNVTLPGPDACSDWIDVTVHDGVFYIVAGDWSVGSCAFRSTDGETWTSIAAPDRDMFVRGISLSGSLYVAAHFKSDLMTPRLYRLNGDAFEAASGFDAEGQGRESVPGRATAFGNRPYTLVGDRKIRRIDAVSPWTTSEVDTTALVDAKVSMFGLAARGSKLVVVGWSTDPKATARGVTAMREGETEWSVSSTNVELNRVLDTGDRFIAIGKAGTIMESPDGAAWTAATSPTGESLNAIAVAR